MTANNERRPAGHGHGVQNELACSSKDTAERSRCDLPLPFAQFVARSYGPICWGRTELGTLDLARLDLAGLAVVATSLDMVGGAA